MTQHPLKRFRVRLTKVETLDSFVWAIDEEHAISQASGDQMSMADVHKPVTVENIAAHEIKRFYADPLD